jgi:hypothetical protein
MLADSASHSSPPPAQVLHVQKHERHIAGSKLLISLFVIAIASSNNNCFN